MISSSSPETQAQSDELTAVGASLAGLSERFTTFSASHLRELKTAWAGLEELIGQLLRDDAAVPEWNGELESLAGARRELRQHFLTAPLGRIEAAQPHRRALLAVETFEAKLRDLSDLFPSKVNASWKQFSGWLDQPEHRSPKVRLVRLRSVARAVFLARSKAWRPAQDAIMRGFWEALWLVASLWREISLCADRSAALAAQKNCAEHWKALAEQQSAALGRLGTEFSQTAQTLPLGLWKRLAKRPKPEQGDFAAHRTYWDAQLRSREGELRLLKSSESAWDRIHRSFLASRRAAQDEQQALLAEIHGLLNWLELSLESAEDLTDPPLSKGKVTPALRRLDELDESVISTARRLPSSISWLKTRQAHPPRRENWQQVYPEESLGAAWKDLRQETTSVLESWEAAIREIALGTEQARQVIRFALELTQEGDSEVGRDALGNARDLLSFQASRQSEGFAPERSLSTLLAYLYEDYLLRIGTSRRDAFAFRLRRGFERSSHTAERSVRELTVGAIRSAATSSKLLAGRALEEIGFSETEKSQSAVYRRTYLPTQFLNKSERELPAIYQRLFRIEPIEDARFLIGRRQESDALVEALESWRLGRRVAALIAGQRGSGKTSLLNCFQAEVSDTEVLRSQFCERLTQPVQVEEFLRNLLGVEAESDLVQELTSRRRIIILEELERTFLRTVGGFEAIKAFQELITATCDQTLWILAINQVSLRLLNSAVRLQDVFSHRIETAAVSRADLETAIMTRHNLSGLRLRFASRHETPSAVSTLRRRVLGAKDPREQFFDSLLAQSRGVYRSAQEIWLAHIDSIEAGQVYMEPIDMPDSSHIINDLDQDDLFTLLSVMQHGSFTWEEHAMVFGCSQGMSRMRITESIGRELLEQDPNHPGFRVRPEAMAVVKDALFRKNLL